MCSVCFTGFRCRTRASASFFLLPFSLFSQFLFPTDFFSSSHSAESVHCHRNLYFWYFCIFVYVNTQTDLLDTCCRGVQLCVWVRERESDSPAVEDICCFFCVFFFFFFFFLGGGGGGGGRLWLTCCRGHLLWGFFFGGGGGSGGGLRLTCCRGHLLQGGSTNCCRRERASKVFPGSPAEVGGAVWSGCGAEEASWKKGSSVGGSRCTQRPSLRGAGQRQVKGWRGATRETLLVKALQQRGKHCRTRFTHTAFTSCTKLVLCCKGRTRYCEV